MKHLALAIVLALSITAAAQSAPQATTNAAPPATAGATTSLLAKLDSTVDAAKLTLARLRIEKWKTDRDMKQHLQTRVADSLNTNMQAALPQMMASVRSNPNDLGANFRLYRNLDALLDVYSDFAQAADAFAPREEAQAVAQDFQAFNDVRRALADQFEGLLAMAQADLARLTAAQQQAVAAAAAKPAEPKKIVVDENKPARKPARKKKPAATPAPKG